MNNQDKLRDYKKRRDFSITSEPSGISSRTGNDTIFIVQKHDASNLHYDLRIESDGVLKSWAIPKGPSMDPNIKRLAIPTEDHPIAYAGFEGIIPEGQYGAGTVIIWDSGKYWNAKKDEQSILKNIIDGHVTIYLEGSKLKGNFALIRTNRGGNRSQWLFFKMKDKYARPGSHIASEKPNSSKTGRSIEEVREQEITSDLNDFKK